MKTNTRSRPTGRPVWVAVVLAAPVVVAAATGVLLTAKASPQANTGPYEAAPDFVLAEFHTGDPVRLSDLLGRPVVYNYWASWCAPCLAEMPTFEAVSRQAPEVVFVGINIADEFRSAERVVEETGVTYLLLSDAAGETFPLFGGIGMPTTVFIAADGTVRETYTGGLSLGQLEARLDSHFDT